MAFDSGVSAPPTSAYGPPQVDMSWIGDLLNKYAQGQQQKFAQQQRDLVTQQQQTFKDQPLPTDKNGNIDYSQITQMLAQKGDIGAIAQMAPLVRQQQLDKLAATPDPMMSGGGPQPQPAPFGAPAPVSVPTRATVPAQGGGDQAGSLVDVVSRKMQDDAIAGRAVASITDTIKKDNPNFDPNAPLTLGQLRRVTGLLPKYIPADSTAAAPSGSATARVDQSFAALPPSAGAVTPAATVQPRPQAQPQQTAQAPQAQQQPLVPQVPLPPGFGPGQEQQAILALNREASLIGRTRPDQAAALQDWAKRIDASIQPIAINGNQVLRDPRTGAIIAQGPQAAAMANAEPSPTLDADAERYRQTGQLPPNRGGGVLGQRQATAIRSRAVELEYAAGGDPANWPENWQKYAAQAAGRRVLTQRAANLTLAENESETLIPRVRDISAKVSRTQYPTLNSLILAAHKGTGGEDVIKLGVAVSSLIPVYARVLKPTGQITEGDTNRAHDILDKAWSDGQINAALDQMQVELKSARTALNKTMKEYGTRGGGDDSAPQGEASNNQGWTTLPNGVRIREVQ